MDPAWGAVSRFARAHHGVISSHEAATLAVPPYRLVAWARSGRLTRVAPSTYVITGSTATWHQRARIATAQDGVWASHRAAAALWRLDGFDRRTIETITLHGRRRRRDWLVHESRTLRGVDLATTDGIDATSLVRTLVDLPAVAHPHLVALALDDAARRHPGLVEAVAQRHLELPRRGRRGAKDLTELLDERLGRGRFTDTEFETKALTLVRSAGLPEPVLQHPVRDGEFVAYLDLAWPEVRWWLECDSLAWHTGKQPHEWDRQRRRRLKRLAWDGVEVTFDDVTIRREATGRELRALFAARRSAVLAA